MNTVGVVLVLSLSLCARAAGLHLTAGVPNVRHLPCDSTDAEEAAQVAVDHINTQHHHGYKYTLNQIDDIKVLNRLPFGETYILEVDLLETKCHVLDPTPAENCTVRSLPETKVEGDCDVALMKVDGVFTVSSFRCKTSPDSAEDVAKICVGCPHLIPLNDSVGQQAITKSLHKFNVELPEPEEFALLEVSRVAGQVHCTHVLYI
ncbi:FETUA protein, partial [Amia calva]|nr:FETUA protein [Amia calva]